MSLPCRHGLAWLIFPRRHEVGGLGDFHQKVAFGGFGEMGFPVFQEFLGCQNMIIWAEMMKSVFFIAKTLCES